MTTVFSNQQELQSIAKYLIAYMKIPYFQDDSIPGKIMEKIVSLVRGGEQLATYDYVDVAILNDIGWSVKSTKESTPLTWKRAKIANSSKLIEESMVDSKAAQRLGNEIINFCNSHAQESLQKYKLKKIGYSRLILLEDSSAIYFERELCSLATPKIFNPADYTWKWSTQKKSEKKEQLSALHGMSMRGGEMKKAFAWHGQGENQLHFSGETQWWPNVKPPSKFGDFNYSADGHAIAFRLPESKVNWDDLVVFLNRSS